MPRSWQAAALAIAVAALLCAALGASVDGVLCLAPALLLSGALLARRYPGERLLLGLSARARARRPRPPAGLRPPAGPSRHVPRGGLLIAFELAVRPPPLARTTS